MKFQNIFAQLKECQSKIGHLEHRILELEQQLKQMIQVDRNHLVRVKNNEELSDDFIVSGRKYSDLTPEKAWKLYNNLDFDFIFIDVSEGIEKTEKHIPDAHHIPWSSFPERFTEIPSRTTPILIISEDGTNSILACEFLAERGYFNCNNISGGFEHWKGFKFQAIKGISA